MYAPWTKDLHGERNGSAFRLKQSQSIICFFKAQENKLGALFHDTVILSSFTDVSYVCFIASLLNPTEKREN
jgi:hypothetical protein